MRSACLLVLLGLAAPLAADTAPALPPAPAPTFRIRELDLGAFRPDVNTPSSRFFEYRGMPNGFVIPYFRFAGNRDFFYDVRAANALQADARYQARLEPGSMRITGDFLKIPHRLGNDARSILLNTSENTFSLSPTLRGGTQQNLETQFSQNRNGVNFAYLNGLVAPSLATTSTFDLAVNRDRGHLEVALNHDVPSQLRATYFVETRHGYRSAGTSFGLSSTVETAEPIDYKTEDFRLSGEWSMRLGLLRAGVSFNRFMNRYSFLDFANPFRATDATDIGARLSPGTNSVAGAAMGRLSLPPDNSALTGSLGFIARFAGNSRLTVDTSLGDWRQNEPFIAYTTNSRIMLPDGRPANDVSVLPASSLDGDMRAMTLSSLITSRPVAGLSLTARFRRYHLDNRTARIPFAEGHANFDGMWLPDPRVSVPYGYATDNAQATAAYDFGRLVVEGGYRMENWDRHFRETGRTLQNTGYARADLRFASWMTLRGNYEKGSRSYRGLDIGRSWGSSFEDPGLPNNLLAIPGTTRQANGEPLCAGGTVCNLRFDQAAKNLSRVTGLLELSPLQPVTLTLTYLRALDDYDQTTYGLISSSNQAFSADLDYAPTDRLSLFGFYMRENIGTFQRGRQSGNPLSTSLLDDWTSDIRDRVNTVGGGASFSLPGNRLDVQLSGSYQKADGNNDLFSPPGGTPDVAFSIPLVDDTKLLTLSAELGYRLAAAWRLTLGGWFEDYRLADAATTGLPYYGPGAFYLAPNEGSYRGNAVYLRASYVW